MKNLKLKSLLLIMIILSCAVSLRAQNTFPSAGRGGIYTTTPNSSAALDIDTIGKGLLIPRMTKVQRDAILSPAVSLLIYQTNNTPGFYYFDGTVWAAVSGKSANKSLSNLTAPTAVNMDMLPGTSNAINFGSSTLRWKDVNLYNLKFSDGTIQTTASTQYTSGTGISISGNVISVANSGVTTATYGSATQVPQYTVDAKGRITSAGNITISGVAPGGTASGDLSGTYPNPTIGSGAVTSAKILDGTITNGDISGTAALAYSKLSLGNSIVSADIANGTITSSDLNTSGVAAGSYGSSSLIPVITVDAQGRVTSATTTAPGGGNANLSLSNLTATSINQSLLPNADNSLDLGASSMGWRNINLTGKLMLDGLVLLDNGGLSTCVFVGTTQNVTNAGHFTTAVGNQALQSNIAGTYNTAVGAYGLNKNTDGEYNTATGSSALYYNTEGSYNTANGLSALNSNTIGNFNTANGFYALFGNTVGSENTANGMYALMNNTSANQNTAIGNRALLSQSYNPGYNWVSNNVAVGHEALLNNQPTSTINGINNTAVGNSALFFNTTGGSNTAQGFQSLYYNTEGFFNTANGFDALYSNITGWSNTANGNEALYSNTTGYGNSGTGDGALFYNSTGDYNTGTGRLAMTSVGDLSFGTAMGAFATVNASNKVRIGDIGIGVIEGQVPYSSPSDGRFKENIKEDVKGLDFIMKLQPVSYNFNRLKFAKHVRQQLTPERERTLVEESQNRSVGFIAQDVEKIIEQTGFTSFDVVHAPTNETDNYSMGYAEFVVPLVKAVQELSNANDELSAGLLGEKNENEKLHLKNKEFENRLSKIEVMFAVNIEGNVSSTGEEKVLLEGNNGYSLGQNVPNPFMSKTTIPYSVPAILSSASIVFQNERGIVLKTIELKPGSGTVEVETRDLASGVYQYSLIIDGRIVSTKQMEHIK